MRANKLGGGDTLGWQIQIPICSGACFPATNHPLGRRTRLLFGGNKSGRDIGNLALDAAFTAEQI
jgi:hypothetical protein